MSDPMKHKTIDDVLQAVSSRIATNHVGETMAGYQGRRKHDDKFVEEAKKALASLIEREIIGENEKYNDTYEPDKIKAEYKVWQNGNRVNRNELRNEQRIALDTLLGNQAG